MRRGVRSKRLPFATALIALFMGSAYLLAAQAGKEAGALSRRLAPTNHTLEVGCHPLEPWEEEGTGILFYTALLIYDFVGLAIVCDDFFVASLEQVCWLITPEECRTLTLLLACSLDSSPSALSVAATIDLRAFEALR